MDLNAPFFWGEEVVHIGGFFGWVMGFFIKLRVISSNDNLGAFSIELASRRLGIHPRASRHFQTHLTIVNYGDLKFINGFQSYGSNHRISRMIRSQSP
jgi:hypothetical protein